jgi:hypothetical protein
MLACCSLILFVLGALPVMANEGRGIVVEMGWGKFKVKDDSGVIKLYYVEKKTTTFEPTDWRPTEGEKILLAYTEVLRRSETILRVDKVKLLKAGAQTIRIKSPVDVEIVEVGRSGFKTKILASGKAVKFLRHRRTQVIPAGWVPVMGEKARIEFIVKPGRVSFGLSYQADKVELIK